MPSYVESAGKPDETKASEPPGGETVDCPHWPPKVRFSHRHFFPITLLTSCSLGVYSFKAKARMLTISN